MSGGNRHGAREKVHMWITIFSTSRCVLATTTITVYTLHGLHGILYSPLPCFSCLEVSSVHFVAMTESSNSYKCVWAPQLAKAGLYYDPKSEGTICFVCGFRKPASFWLKGRNTFHFHRIDSPNCKYITGQCKENVPFHTREQRKNELSISSQTALVADLLQTKVPVD